MSQPVDGSPHFCTNCGQPLSPGAHFCASCGAEAAGEPKAPAPPGPMGPPSPPDAGAAGPAELGTPLSGGPSAPAPGGPPMLAPPAKPEPDRNRPIVPILIGAALVLALVAGVLFVIVTVGDGDGDSTELAAGEIFLEPTATIGPDPFTDRVLESAPISTTSSLVPPPTTSATTVPTTAGGATAVRTVNGSTPGLFGGTGSQSRCDGEGMIAFLQTHPAQAQAWAAALNSDPTLRWSGGNTVRVDQIPAYIRELTPVTLIQDTRVINHGFRNGRPTPRQSVLQAGTAVLVDRFGVPRARCACGNPLIPPRPTSVPPTYVGTPWPGFSPTNIIIVNQVNVEINVFVLVELNTGGTFERPAGSTGGSDSAVTPPGGTTSTTATTSPTTSTTSTPPLTAPPLTVPPPPVTLGSGDVQMTLIWGTDDDLDLHVIDPSRTEISYGNPTSPTGGSLDFDDIPDCGDPSTHVENVFWASGGAPRGNYQVYVVNLGGCSNSSSYRLEVRVNGQVVAFEDGFLNGGDSSSPVSVDF